MFKRLWFKLTCKRCNSTNVTVKESNGYRVATCNFCEHQWFLD